MGDPSGRGSCLRTDQKWVHTYVYFLLTYEIVLQLKILERVRALKHLGGDALKKVSTQL